MALTATATVWVPAFPPIDATIGISTARATSRSMVPSNTPITTDAKIAVTKLTNNHAVRPFIVSTT